MYKKSICMGPSSKTIAVTFCVGLLRSFSCTFKSLVPNIILSSCVSYSYNCISFLRSVAAHGGSLQGCNPPGSHANEVNAIFNFLTFQNALQDSDNSVSYAKQVVSLSLPQRSVCYTKKVIPFPPLPTASTSKHSNSTFPSCTPLLEIVCHGWQWTAFTAVLSGILDFYYVT